MDIYLCEHIEERSQAYGLLAWALARRGISPLPRLERTAQGKPFFPDLPQVHFSISHSGPLALCAIDCRPVGADIELLRPHHPHLPQRICSPEQLRWLEAQPAPGRALCQLWTMKESRVKYLGTGLTVPLRSIRVPLPPPASAADCDGLTFFCLEGPNWTASLCGHTPPQPPIRVPAQALVPVTPPAPAHKTAAASEKKE